MLFFDKLMTNREIIIGSISKETKNKLFLSEKYFYIPPSEESLRIPIDHLNKIQNMEIDGKNIPSLFMYDIFSMWWFIHPVLFPEIKKIIHFIIKLENLVKQEKPCKIIITKNFKMLFVVKQICKKYHIPIDYSKINLLKYKTYEKFRVNGDKLRYKKINDNKINSRKKIFFNNYKNIPTLENKIIFGIPTVYRRQEFDQTTKNFQSHEYIQQHLINNLEGNILGIDFDYTFRGDFKILQQRIDSELDWFPLEILFKENSNLNFQKFIKEFNDIVKNQNFQNLFSFNGIFYWEILEHLFQKLLFSPYIPFYIKIIVALENIFKKQKPKAIFLPYETGPYALAFILIAKKFNVKTFGIQHGIIYQNSPMYSFEEFYSENKTFGFPLPDNLLLFGNYVKTLLQNNGYPKEKLKIIGNPEFFEIEKLKISLSEKNIQKQFKLKKDQKIILFTLGKLQPYYSENGIQDYDVQIFKYLVEKFSNDENYFIILKPHPSENNMEIYENLLANYSPNNFIISKRNLQELIYISSIVISVGSTTMIDSLCFDKFVIQVLFGNKQFLPMLEKNNVVITTQLSNLEKNILNITLNPTCLNSIKENTKIFLTEQYNFPNGNFDQIKKLLDDKNKIY